MEFTLMNDTTDHGFTITRDHDGEEKRGRQRGRQLGKPHPLPPTLLPVAEFDLELVPELRVSPLAMRKGILEAIFPLAPAAPPPPNVRRPRPGACHAIGYRQWFAFSQAHRACSRQPSRSYRR